MFRAAGLSRHRAARHSGTAFGGAPRGVAVVRDFANSTEGKEMRSVPERIGACRRMRVRHGHRAGRGMKSDNAESFLVMPHRTAPWRAGNLETGCRLQGGRCRSRPRHLKPPRNPKCWALRARTACPEMGTGDQTWAVPLLAFGMTSGDADLVARYQVTQPARSGRGAATGARTYRSLAPIQRAEEAVEAAGAVPQRSAN